jgi:hypothetical protein
VGRGTGTMTIPDTEIFMGTKLLNVILIPDQDSNSAVGVASDVQTITVP